MSKKQVLTEQDRQLVLLTQAGLPLLPEPYCELGKQLGISADQVMSRLQAMLERQQIRRIAAVPNHYALGYKNNAMVVWDVDNELIGQLGPRVAALDCVSHCYKRPRYLPEWPYNFFTMVHGTSSTEVDVYITQIKEVLGSNYQAHEKLYSLRILKKTGLRLKDR